LMTERREDVTFDSSSACQQAPEGGFDWQASYGLSTLQWFDLALLESDETL
jgi:hypothetical protein